MTSLPRYLLMVGLIAAAAVFLHARKQEEILPPRLPLASFPHQVGEWQGADVYIEKDILAVLGDGEFLLRIYRTIEKPYVDFFVAYFPTQRTGSTIHSPQNCLPGAGWAPEQHTRIPIERPGSAPLVVNRYVIAKGIDRQVVLYWYQSNGRVVASEYWAKIYLVSDSIRKNRSDGALVRVVTPVAKGEEVGVAENRAVAFARSILPELEKYIPR